MVVAHSACRALAHGPEDGDSGGGGIGNPPEERGRETNLQQHLQVVHDPSQNISDTLNIHPTLSLTDHVCSAASRPHPEGGCVPGISLQE